MLAALAVGLLGVLIEVLLLRRIYRAPELFQLLATFALVLVIKDVALFAWGAEDLLGPRAPGLAMAVEILGKRIPAYDLLLIAIGPVVLARLWLLLTRTRWGVLVRAATAGPRDGRRARRQPGLALHLGVRRSARCSPASAARCRSRASPPTSSSTCRSSPTPSSSWWSAAWAASRGAFLAALLIGVVKAFCIGVGSHWFGAEIIFSKLTLVVEFLVMAVVLVVRPCGLLGKPQAAQRLAADPGAAAHRAVLDASRWSGLALLLAVPLVADRYVADAADRHPAASRCSPSACTSSWARPAWCSFGHAAYFGLGAYAAGAAAASAAACRWRRRCCWRRLPPAPAPLVFGWFCVRLSGVYLAMLTLAFAQIAWSIVFQWDALTGGSNGLVGVWPSAVARRQDRLLLPRRSPAAALGIAAAVARAVRALRLRAARRPRFAAARRGDRHRRARAINGRPSCSPARSRAWPARCLRLLQGQHLARDDLGIAAVGRRAGHGAARRRRRR